MTFYPTRREVTAGLGAAMMAGPAACQTIAMAQPSGDAALRRIAFGSCNNQRLAQSHWPVISAASPDLMLMMGDNVYGDLDARGPEHLAAAYEQLSRSAAFREFAAATPILATWDDHDYGANDGDASYAHAADAKHQFLEFWNIPAADPRRKRPGLYHAQTFGSPGQSVQVIMLDLRSFRGPLSPGHDLHRNGSGYQADMRPDQILLGEAQWGWLEARLREPADIRLFVSSLQVIGDGGENWKHFPFERRRLFELIASTRAEGVVLLSGDVHTGAIYRFNRNTPYPLYEFTSSSLNQGPQPVAMEEAYLIEGGVFADSNFGLIVIDWDGREIDVSINDMNGRPVRRRRVSFNELRRLR